MTKKTIVPVSHAIPALVHVTDPAPELGNSLHPTWVTGWKLDGYFNTPIVAGRNYGDIYYRTPVGWCFENEPLTDEEFLDRVSGKLAKKTRNLMNNFWKEVVSDYYAKGEGPLFDRVSEPPKMDKSHDL